MRKKWVEIGGNGSENGQNWDKMKQKLAEIGQKWAEIGGNRSENSKKNGLKLGKNGLKWAEIGGNGSENGQNWDKMG